MSIDARLAPEQRASVSPAVPPPPAAAPPRPEPAQSGVELATLVGFQEDGAPLVQRAAEREPTAARSTVALAAQSVGRSVVLAFLAADDPPIVLGVLEESLPAAELTPAELTPEPSSEPLSVTADGQRVVLSAEREIELRCGKASITLTRAGKILIRGAYVLSRSSGVNRIKGGAVHIN